MTGICVHFIDAAITSNITESTVCPGDELFFICVSQGNLQRWRLKDEDGTIVINHLFRRGDRPVYQQSQFRFTLVSSDYNHFESTASVTATASQNNHVLECAAGLQHDEVTIHITGFFLRCS